MAKIHWLIYIIVGLFVSILSWRLNYQKLIFFFYAGVIFIVIGAVKIGLNLIKNKETKPKVVHHKAQHQFPRFKRCQKCGNAARLNDIFCGKCGSRV